MVALSTICFCGCGGEMISKQAKEYEDSLGHLQKRVDSIAQ